MFVVVKRPAPTQHSCSETCGGMLVNLVFGPYPTEADALSAIDRHDWVTCDVVEVTTVDPPRSPDVPPGLTDEDMLWLDPPDA